jgi:chromosomal replication initiation ATPase DnaA
MKLLSLWKGEILVHPGTMNQIGQRVADQYGISVDDLKRQNGGCKVTRSIAYPRHEAMWLMAMETFQNGSPRHSYPRIAAWFGMDHSSVISGVRGHARRNGLDMPQRAVGSWKFAA